MNKFNSLIFMFIFMFVSSLSYAEEKSGVFASENFSATVSLTSDYISHGVSYSNHKPALQATLDYLYKDTGVFAGLWYSNFDDNGLADDIELGAWVGQAAYIGPIDYDMAVYYWFYPGAQDAGAEWDYMQTAVDVGHTFKDAPLSPTVTFGYMWSPQYSGEDGTGQIFMGKLGLDLIHGYSFGLEAGHCDVQGDKTTGNGYGMDGGNGFHWNYYTIGLLKTLPYDFKISLNYNKNDEAKFFKAAYGGKDVAGDSAYLTVSKKF